jgi:hypothetical protein
MKTNRIGFAGTVSVGKSTLVKELSKLPEFSEYVIRTERSQYLRDLGIPLNTDSTLLGQIVFLAERSSELLQSNIITDRTVIDVIAFSNLSKSMSVNEQKHFRHLAFNLIEKYDYIFYVSPQGVEIEDNGVRTIDPHYRELLDDEIKEIYNIWVPYSKQVKLSGSTDDRIKTVLQTVFP